MKVLIVMGGFFPGKKYGGPPVSVDNFCTLMRECECYIVTKDHDLGENSRYSGIKNGWNKRDNCQVLYLSDVEYNIKYFEKIIQEVKPDILYLQGLFQDCVLSCLYLAKKYSLRVLLAPRGELCDGAINLNRLKKLKKVLYIKFLRVVGLISNVEFQSTSDEETESIKAWLGKGKDSIYVLPNIPSIPKKSYEYDEKITGKAKFVFLSRIHPKKNLIFALECLKQVQGIVEFDIYGSIEDKEYWNECQKLIRELPENIKVEYKGIVSHDEVHDVFAKYDAFLFPTLSENYGHVILEAMAVGCPVIISDQTPWNDVEEYGAGWALSLNKQEFSNKNQMITNMDNFQLSTLRFRTQKYVNRICKLDKLKSIYINIFRRLMVR